MIIKNINKYPQWLGMELIKFEPFIILPEDIPFSIVITLNGVLSEDPATGIREITTFVGYLNILELANTRLKRDW